MARSSPTETYVALLRGVNVGGKNRVPMAQWKALLEAEGCRAVRTLLNSGNAVFQAPPKPAAAWAQRIHQMLLQALGVDVVVVVKTAAQFGAAVAENPLAAVAAEPSRLFVTFAPDEATLQGLAPIGALVQAPEQFQLGAHAAWLWCPNGALESKAGAALLGRAGRAATSRNWATVQKIALLAAAAAA